MVPKGSLRHDIDGMLRLAVPPRDRERRPHGGWIRVTLLPRRERLAHRAWPHKLTERSGAIGYTDGHSSEDLFVSRPAAYANPAVDTGFLVNVRSVSRIFAAFAAGRALSLGEAIAVALGDQRGDAAGGEC